MSLTQSIIFPMAVCRIMKGLMGSLPHSFGLQQGQPLQVLRRFAASRLRRCRLHDRRRARRRRRADRAMMGAGCRIAVVACSLNPKFEVSDVDEWACSLVSCQCVRKADVIQRVKVPPK